MFSILRTRFGSIRIACRIIRLVVRVRSVSTANSLWKPGECSWGCGIAFEDRFTTEGTEGHRGECIGCGSSGGRCLFLHAVYGGSCRSLMGERLSVGGCRRGEIGRAHV